MTLRFSAIIWAIFMLQPVPVQGNDYAGCRFDHFTMPANALVYAAGAYSGRNVGWKMNREGEGGVMRVAVNSPERPVVLLLGAYNPTVWHIGWTEGTKIAAVAVSGYHAQALVGLPPETKVLNSLVSGPRFASGPGGQLYRCPYFTDVVKPENKANIDLMSNLLIGRVPDGFFSPSPNGQILVGPLIQADQPVFSATELNRAEFDLNWPLENFLLTAIRQKRLRPATAREYVEWVEAKNKAAGLSTQGLEVPFNLTASRPWNLVWAYVILDQNLMADLAEKLPKFNVGGSSFAFYLPAGMAVPQPINGAMLLSLKDGTCVGRNCGNRHLSPIFDQGVETGQ